jgi:hypothetical protein
MDSLEKNLTCIKCKRVPRNATVSWCSAHHLWCQSCCDIYYSVMIAQNVQPPLPWACGKACKVQFKPELSPFVANVLKEFPTKCKFTQNGCEVFIMLKDLEVHEVDCVYRNINCPFLDCNAKDVSFIGLGNHLEANHGNLKKIGKAMSKDFTPWPDMGQVYPQTVKDTTRGRNVRPAKDITVTQVWIPQELAFRNRSFFTEVCCDTASQSRHFWIYFHGTPEEAVHYSYRVKITGENGIELTFKGNVYSLDETKTAIKAKKDVYILFDVQAKRFQVDGQINFEITLYSDKEEIKNEDVESGISEDDEQ